jgi:hypothetical protein
MDLVYEETLYSTQIPEYNKLIPVKNTPKHVKSRPTKTGKFEVYIDKAGEYRFRLKAPNGEIIAASEGYKVKKSCMNGIRSVKKNVRKPNIVELK